MVGGKVDVETKRRNMLGAKFQSHFLGVQQYVTAIDGRNLEIDNWSGLLFSVYKCSL
jgi:hypothetical protein